MRNAFRAISIVLFYAVWAALAHAQPLPAPEQPIVVQAPGVVVEVPAKIRAVETPPTYSTPRTAGETFPPFQPAPYGPVEPPMYQPPSQRPIPVGAVLVSRNFDERLNTSPGYWNHLCVYVGNWKIVESQPETGVHEISYAEYRARPQNVVVVPPPTPEEGQAIAVRAKALVGLPYFRLSSVTLFRRPLERGLNCVSVAEASCRVSLRRPDNIFSWYPARAAGPLQ